MKAIKILTTLMLSFFIGSVVGNVADINPLVTGAFGVGASLIPHTAEAGVLRAGLYPEIWTGIMIKKMRDTDESIGWFGRLKDMSQYANNDVIHMVDIGVDPDVLINNTTYPLQIQNLADGDKSFSLDKYQTKPTRITDDELHNLSYDKKTSVVERHKAKIDETKYIKALHAIAPDADLAATPVLKTTGAATNGRLALTMKDIVLLKEKFDKAKFPTVGRVLVLCSDHVNDLLGNDQKFAQQYYNYTTGKISNLMGFDVYEYQGCPLYESTTGVKLPYGGEATANHRQASIAFHESRVVKATGSTKAYLQDASTAPTTQENLVSFRHYFIALHTKKEGLGAIVSAKA
jgi:hypothetical protein